MEDDSIVLTACQDFKRASRFVGARDQFLGMTTDFTNVVASVPRKDLGKAGKQQKNIDEPEYPGLIEDLVLPFGTISDSDNLLAIFRPGQIHDRATCR